MRFQEIPEMSSPPRERAMLEVKVDCAGPNVGGKGMSCFF